MLDSVDGYVDVVPQTLVYNQLVSGVSNLV